MSEHLELVQGDIIRCSHSDWWKRGDGVSPGFLLQRLILLKVADKYLTAGFYQDECPEWDVLWLSQAYVDQFAKKLMQKEAAGE